MLISGSIVRTIIETILFLCNDLVEKRMISVFDDLEHVDSNKSYNFDELIVDGLCNFDNFQNEHDGHSS